ncbi:MAG: hypothetical protein WBF13_00085 [Candidatus Zixiibacteriota bacterium]
MSRANEFIKREALRAEKNIFIFRLLFVLAGYVGTTLWLNAIRQNAALWFVWVLIAIQLLFYFSIFVACYMRAKQWGARRYTWLIVALAILSRVNDWELVLIPVLALTTLILSELNQKISDKRRYSLPKETSSLSVPPNELEKLEGELQKGNRDAALQRIANIQEKHRAELLAKGIDIRAITPEIGRDIEWTDIVRHAFRVLEFDRAGTTIGPDDTVKAASLLKPYGYLLVESPILNQPAKLPIVHRDDFLLAASVFGEPQLLEAAKDDELLVTYVPKHELPKGLAGKSHALHYVITPRGTLDRYYEVGNDMHMASPAPEKLFGTLVWDGEIRVQVNPHPELWSTDQNRRAPDR